MFELPFFAEFLKVLCYELRTVVYDYFLLNTMFEKYCFVFSTMVCVLVSTKCNLGSDNLD